MKDSLSFAAPTTKPVSAVTRYSAWRGYGIVLTIYFLVTLFTNAHFMADTADYLDSIVSFTGGRYYDFWEFGHLFFRPLGWLLYVTLKPLTSLLMGDGVRINATLVLIALNWCAGLLSVWALYGIISRFCGSKWVTSLVVVAFIFSHGFLNFAQTGSAYIPGLSLLLLGLLILVRRGDSNRNDLSTALLAGLAFAAAVWMWFPYALAMPAAVTSPLFLFGFDRRRWRLSIATALVAASLIALAYAVVAIGVLGIHSFAGFKTWMTAASHDTDIRGITRVVFGFARSFIYMGNDGVLFKRYLLGDPFNHVSLLDLLRLSLWKLVLFYLLLLALCIGLIRSSAGRRILGFLIISSLPVILFAISFDGGAIERYLPLYPAMFLALAVCLSSERSLMFAKYVIIAFIAAVVVTNAVAMAKPLLDRRQELDASRIATVLPRLKPGSRLLTVTWQDELVNFSRSFPFHPLNQTGSLRIGALVTPGTTLTADWRKGFASQTLETWNRGGDMWVSRRALSPRPRPEWNWTEGDDKRLSWPDFHSFFSQIELGESVGGDDGFIMIPPSPKNRQFLEQLAKADEMKAHP